MFSYLITLLLLNSQISNALPIVSGHERGNGGLQLECGTQSTYGEGVFSLDRIEGALRDGRAPAESLNNFSTEVDIIEVVLRKLQTVNPTRAEIYRNWFNQLLSQRHFQNIEVSPINDGDVIYLPQGCKLIQGAVFITDPLQNKIQFLFNKTAWMKTSALDRAYLIMHEIIYREARLPENNHLTSAAARNLNSWLFANIDNLNESAWNTELIKNSFTFGDYNGIAIQLVYTESFQNQRILSPQILYPSGALHKAVLYSTFHIPIKNESPFIRLCPPNRYLMAFDNLVEFYPSGKLKRVHFAPSLFSSSERCGFYQNQFNDLYFSEDGAIEKAIYTPPKFYEFNIYKLKPGLF